MISSNLSFILIIVVLGIYLVWKFMGSSKPASRKPRRFEIGRHRKRRDPDEEDDDDAYEN